MPEICAMKRRNGDGTDLPWTSRAARRRLGRSRGGGQMPGSVVRPMAAL